MLTSSCVWHDSDVEARRFCELNMSFKRCGLVEVDTPARAALLAGWQAGPLLKQAVQAPQRVAEGMLQLSEFRRRTGLMRAALTGRI